MKQGTLVMNTQSGRMDIRLGRGEFYGELHCGTCMDVLINGEWLPTRIEMADDWFLVGINTRNIAGLTVRIK